jgi:hypothetical protein
VEHHLARDRRIVAAVHDAAHDEIPGAGVDRALERNDVADLEAELVASCRPTRQPRRSRS